MAGTRRKGKLRNPDGVVDSTDYVPQLAMPGSHDIIEIKEETWGQIILGWIKGGFAFVLVLILFLALLYSGLSAYLMVFSPTGPDREGYSWVVRNTWSETGNIPPIGSTVVISESTTAPDSWYEFVPVGWLGISDPSVVKVVSKNYDTLYLNNSKVSIVGESGVREGNFVGSPSYSYDSEKDAAEKNYKLKHQYLVECVSGNCEAGTYYVVNEGQIYGEKR